MDTNNFRQRVKERCQRALGKKIFTNLLLLIPPVLLTILIIFGAMYSMGVALLLLYFVLPMYYTVEKRLRHDISGIGKADFNYGDGYKAFFKENMGGIFGAVISLLTAFLILMLVYFVMQYALEPLSSCFYLSNNAMHEINAIYAELYNNTNDIMTILDQHPELPSLLANLAQPLVVIIGLSAFLPSFLVVFYYFNNNLSNHFLATIVLPDIDKNISVSQARAISRVQFGRYISGHRLKEGFIRNWPFYLAYAVIYGILLYSCTFITTNNIYLIPLIVAMAPALSVFFGFILNYFALLNDYAIVEESKDILRSVLPDPIKFSVHQTFANPNYIRGEESAMRGEFIPANTFRQDHPFSSPFDTYNQTTGNTYNGDNFTTTNDNVASQPKEDSSTEAPTGVVIDLSAENKEDEK